MPGINKGLFPLLLGGLGIGTTEFVMMGILPDVASDIHISIPAAGHVISAYAFGVVVGAPLLVALAGHFPPKRILLALMLVFTAFNGLSALAPNYPLLMAARFLSGLPHGAFFGVGAVVASRIAEKGKQAQAISTMFAGLTIANLVMVPIGTWVGHNLGWRYTFGIVAALGIITLAFLRAWLPEIPIVRESNVRGQLRMFRNLDVWIVFLIVAIGTGGLFTWISYIAPLMTHISGFSAQSVSGIMVLAGFGMVVGNLVGGRLTDRFSPAKLCAWMLVCMALTLTGVFFLSSVQPISLVLTFVAGALSIALGTPIQVLMMRTAKGAEMLGAATTQAGFNIGNSLGAYFGGLPIAAGLGFNYPSLVGAGMAVVGIAFAVWLVLRQSAGEVALEVQSCSPCA